MANVANGVRRVLVRQGAAVAMAARPRGPRGDGNLPCVGDVLRENTRLRGELHDREVQLARVRDTLAEAEGEAERLRAALDAERGRRARR